MPRISYCPNCDEVFGQVLPRCYRCHNETVIFRLPNDRTIVLFWVFQFSLAAILAVILIVGGFGFLLDHFSVVAPLVTLLVITPIFCILIFGSLYFEFGYKRRAGMEYLKEHPEKFVKGNSKSKQKFKPKYLED